MKTKKIELVLSSEKLIYYFLRFSLKKILMRRLFKDTNNKQKIKSQKDGKTAMNKKKTNNFFLTLLKSNLKLINKKLIFKF